MAVQPSLYDQLAAEEDQSVQADVQGIPGLRYEPGVLTNEEQAEILTQVNAGTWLTELKRKVQHYGYKYDYKARAIDSSMYVGPLPDFAVKVVERLMTKGLIETKPDQMIVNHYMPPQGIAFHVDCEPCFGDTIVTVSLGSEYQMEFKNIHTDERHRLCLELGSALILSGEARHDWMHGIRRRLTEKWGARQERISLTFRTVTLTQKRG